MKRLSFAAISLLALSSSAFAQSPDWLSTLSQPHTYTQKRASSFDRSGGNADYRSIASGETLTVLDESGPGNVTHIWFTLADDEPHHLKKIVLRVYWDGESTPSVEAPLGDFFGLGLGEYFTFQSVPLAVAPNRALNSFFPMPFQKHARITISNEGKSRVDAFYFNVDYQTFDKPLPPDTLYFHAQYRQASPARGVRPRGSIMAIPPSTTEKTSGGKRTTSGSKRPAAGTTLALPCLFCRIRIFGGAKVTTCSSSMVQSILQSTALGRKITFSVRTVLGDTLFRMHSSALLSLARN